LKTLSVLRVLWKGYLWTLQSETKSASETRPRPAAGGKGISGPYNQRLRRPPGSGTGAGRVERVSLDLTIRDSSAPDGPGPGTPAWKGYLWTLQSETSRSDGYTPGYTPWKGYLWTLQSETRTGSPTRSVRSRVERVSLDLTIRDRREPHNGHPAPRRKGISTPSKSRPSAPDPVHVRQRYLDTLGVETRTGTGAASGRESGKGISAPLKSRRGRSRRTRRTAAAWKGHLDAFEDETWWRRIQPRLKGHLDACEVETKSRRIGRARHADQRRGSGRSNSVPSGRVIARLPSARLRHSNSSTRARTSPSPGPTTR